MNKFSVEHGFDVYNREHILKAFENGKSFIIGYEIQKHQNDLNKMLEDKNMKKQFFIKPDEVNFPSISQQNDVLFTENINRYVIKHSTLLFPKYIHIHFVLLNTFIEGKYLGSGSRNQNQKAPI